MDGFWACLGVILVPLALVLAMVAIHRVSQIRMELDLLRGEFFKLRRHLEDRALEESLAKARAAAGESVGRVEESVVESAPVGAPPVVSHTVELPVEDPAEMAKRKAERQEVIARISNAPGAGAAGPFTPPGATPFERPEKPAGESKQAMSMERRLIRMAVGVGGIAFALAGIFLVKVAFDHNFLTPTVRLTIGTIFGVVLLAIGIWRQKKEAGIAQSLSAAGIADLFACFLAATNVYHLISPPTGFLLLALTTGLAVVLSLRQGPFVALLGFAGGFLTPALIDTGHPSAVSLFGYLILLHVGLITVTRVRKWAWLAGLTALASFAWVGLWLCMQPWNPADGEVLGVFLLLVGASVVVTAAMNEEAWHSSPWVARALAYLAMGLSLIFSIALLGMSHFSMEEWAFFGLISAGSFVLARIRAVYEPLAWLSVLWVGGTVAVWRLMRPLDVDELRLVVIVAGIVFSLGAYGCLWGSRAPLRWAWLSVVSAWMYTLVAYFTLGIAPRPEVWAILPAGVAVMYAGFALAVGRKRGTMRFGEETLAALVIGSVVALAFAPPMIWEGAVLTAVWSVFLPLTALLAAWLRIGRLRLLIDLCLVLLVLRLLDPDILVYSTGPSLFWNPIIWAYVPSFLSIIVAILIVDRSRRADERSANALHLMEGAGASLIFVFITLFIRRMFHADTLTSPDFKFFERATYPVLWLPAAFAFIVIGLRSNRKVVAQIGYVALTLATVFVVMIQTLALSPLWTPNDVGSLMVWNGLLYAYGVPLVLIGGFATRQLYGEADRSTHNDARALAIVALGLLFVLVTLEVRQAFQGGNLVWKGASSAEMYAYSAAWAVLGTALLLGGIATRGPILRWASLAVMLVTIIKVFLFDTANLSDIFRVLSFAGLGASLILLGFLYHYFVFGKAKAAAVAGTPVQG